MVIIKFNSKTRLSEIIHNGTSIDCLILYDKITNEFELLGHMMVNEVEVDRSNITRVREFASHKDGHMFDLIICGGIANNVV